MSYIYFYNYVINWYIFIKKKLKIIVFRTNSIVIVICDIKINYNDRFCEYLFIFHRRYIDIIIKRRKKNIAIRK